LNTKYKFLAKKIIRISINNNKLFVPKGAQHDQHTTNRAEAKLGTVLGAQ